MPGHKARKSKDWLGLESAFLMSAISGIPNETNTCNCKRLPTQYGPAEFTDSVIRRKPDWVFSFTLRKIPHRWSTINRHPFFTFAFWHLWRPCHLGQIFKSAWTLVYRSVIVIFAKHSQPPGIEGSIEDENIIFRWMSEECCFCLRWFNTWRSVLEKGKLWTKN